MVQLKVDTIVHSVSGSGQVSFNSSFSSEPLPNSVWAIENTSVEFQIYRVVSIEEKMILNIQLQQLFMILINIHK